MLSLHHALPTPEGKPVARPMPVALVVAWVILVSNVLTHNLGVDDAAPATMSAVTVIVPVALTVAISVHRQIPSLLDAGINTFLEQFV